MKTSTLFSVASLALAANASPLDFQLQANGSYANAPQGERIIPPLHETPIIDGATRTEILYGPYTIPGEKMIAKAGLMAQVPCSDCWVTAMRATLKYTNGSEALTSEGAWLHHTVLGNTPLGVIWAAGNERPTIRLNSQHKYGLEFTGKSMFYTVDLMSEAKAPMDVSMAITYEWIPKDSEMGKKYKGATMKWLQIAYPMPEPGKKVYKGMIPMSAGVNGKLLYTIGHMHDGGTNLKLLINGKTACDSVMYYDIDGKIQKAKQTGAVARRSPEPQHSHGGSFGGVHIASPGACTDYGEIKTTDKMDVEAYYDFDQFKTMTHEGKEERLMGNCRVYIGPE
ncbi:hypothetical protein BT63DRAFT_464449 [Microthyrium microscopicum]|uniref:Peptidase C1A papain C-terminal domain-containing protein n=1 Tax=Microthyrium microscopicum TaxID=703497 RepID=A0A6A6TZR2_9PEZI|nr:hypothetical protein BT63DRAFT_464449 [Microthyrium microscopicum]